MLGKFPDCTREAVVLTKIDGCSVKEAATQTGLSTAAVSGFVAGIVAGVLGTVGYSLDCVADDPAVVAFRYGAAVLVCGAVGALAGRYVLKW